MVHVFSFQKLSLMISFEWNNCLTTLIVNRFTCFIQCLIVIDNKGYFMVFIIWIKIRTARQYDITHSIDKDFSVELESRYRLSHEQWYCEQERKWKTSWAEVFDRIGDVANGDKKMAPLAVQWCHVMVMWRSGSPFKGNVANGDQWCQWCWWCHHHHWSTTIGANGSLLALNSYLDRNIAPLLPF
jgi:hypothetical protein